jgi:hypothetical protein
MIRYLFLLMLVSSVAKAQVTDDFSDGDFTNNPAWSGDVGAFIVNASQQLQLNSSGTGISYLSSTLNLTSLDSSEWRCYVSQTFSGSASNNGKIYLTSDQANLEGPLNGYFIQLGEALSNDAVELFKQSGTTVTSIARGTNAAIANSFAIGVKVTRSNNAEWKLYVDYGGGTNYLFQAGGTDATFNTSAFFGVVCTYTSSNATNFFFDNFFYGPIAVDTIPPAAINATAASANMLDVFFSESLDAAGAEVETNYAANNNIGIPTLAALDATNKSLLHLTFATNFPVGLENTLTINNVADLNNNVIDANTTVDFVLPGTPSKNDILINEILFNPAPDEFDFVELYNNSNKIFDLKNIFIAKTDTKDSLASSLPVSIASKYFYPGTYLLLTENISSIIFKFPGADTTNYLETDIPSYNDDEDAVVVTDDVFNRIDQFNYSEDYHYPILNNKEGVSLERISITAPTQNKTNWHSAAQTVHYGTPGYRNSQSIISLTSQELGVDPEVFSPDNDGYNDVLSINYNLGETGYTATVSVFDGDGREIKTIANNELVPRWGSYYWDGINDKNEKARIGIYVVMMEATNINGNKKKLKKGFVLAGKL